MTSDNDQISLDQKPDVKLDDPPDVIKKMIEKGDYIKLHKHLENASLINSLKKMGDLTIFAPVNDAFTDMVDQDKIAILEPQNLDSLKSILKYYVVEGKFDLNIIKEIITSTGRPLRLPTLQGGLLSFTRIKDKLHITTENGTTANILFPDIHGANGFIHGIDAILIPQAQ